MNFTVKKSDLYIAVKRLNIVCKTPRQACTAAAGEIGIHYGIGNYYISSNSKGFALRQIVNQFGASMDVLGTGYIAKKELYGLIKAYEKGCEVQV